MFLVVIFLSNDILLHTAMLGLHIRDKNVNRLEGECDELEINGTNKTIIELYSGINELKEGY